MATLVRMPPLSETMEEGCIISWLKGEGAPVAAGEGLYEVETDKVTVIVEAPAAGILRRILLPAGAVAPIGTVLAIIGDSTEDISGLTP
jgi:pyruvate dehydrogenase E2 component (dihydrolipoamide acetyltransferase)